MSALNVMLGFVLPTIGESSPKISLLKKKEEKEEKDKPFNC